MPSLKPPFFEIHAAFNACFFSCFLVCVSSVVEQKASLVQLRGRNKTFFYNNPLFWKVSKVSVFWVCLLAIFQVPLSWKHNFIVVSEKFATANFHKRAIFES